MTTRGAFRVYLATSGQASSAIRGSEAERAAKVEELKRLLEIAPDPVSFASIQQHIRYYAQREEIYQDKLRDLGKYKAVIDLTESIISFQYIESEDKIDHVEMEVLNERFQFFDEPFLRAGAVLLVSFGYPGAMVPDRIMVVGDKRTKGYHSTKTKTAQEGQHVKTERTKVTNTLKVIAYSRTVLMDQLKRTQTWLDRPLSRIIREVASRNGYEQQNVDISLSDDTVLPVCVQKQETDAVFLHKLSKQFLAHFYIDHNGFHFAEKRYDSKIKRILVHGNESGATEILSYSVDDVVSHMPSSVVVAGRNPVTGEQFISKATAITEKNALANNSSHAKVKIDAKTLEIKPLEEPKQAKTLNATPPTQQDVKTTSYQSKTLTTRIAQASYDYRSQGAIHLDLTVVGDATIRAKDVILVKGLGTALSGRYWVSELTHSIGSSGFTTVLKTKSTGYQGNVGTKVKTSNPKNLVELAQSVKEQGVELKVSTEYKPGTTGINQLIWPAVRTANGSSKRMVASIPSNADEATIKKVAEFAKNDPNNAASKAEREKSLKELKSLGVNVDVEAVSPIAPQEVVQQK